MASNEKSANEAFALLQALQSNAQNLSRQDLEAALQKITSQLSAVSLPTTPPQPPPPPPDLNTTQQQPLQGMIQNRAGGYSYAVDDITRLRRFIVIGAETNSHNAAANNQTVVPDSIRCVNDLLRAGRGREVLDIITEMAVQARVAREENILLVLRECAFFEGEAMYDENTTLQRAAYDRVVRICNIPTKLFRFLELSEAKVKQRWKPTEKQKESKSQLKRRLKAEAAAKVPTESVEEKPESAKSKKKKKKKSKKPKAKPPAKPRISKKSSMWGRMRRRGISAFYTDPNKNAARLLLLLTKYKSRHNWDHKQVLGFTHPKMTGDEAFAKNIVMKYCTRGYDKYKQYIDKHVSKTGIDSVSSQVISFIEVLEKVKGLSADNPEHVKKAVELINQYGVRPDEEEFTFVYPGQVSPKNNPDKKKCAFQLSREHLPTGFQKLREIWVALLKDMPMTALIRNLGRMTSKTIFDEEINVKLAETALTDSKRLRRARIHPVKVLIAAKMYNQGHGDQGNRGADPLTWSPNQRIYLALDKAFYLSFRQSDVESSFKTGKKFLLALDVSGSMTWSGCYGCEQLTPAVASFALAMVTWNIEDDCKVFAFGSKLTNIEGMLKKNMTIDEAMNVGRKLNFGRTDCSLPMIHATQNNMDVDVFIVYTDSDTWFGNVHPSEALKQYRIKMNKPDAKMIVMAMQATSVTIADPNDKYMLDICGFDANVPEIVYEFAKGGIS